MLAFVEAFLRDVVCQVFSILVHIDAIFITLGYATLSLKLAVIPEVEDGDKVLLLCSDHDDGVKNNHQGHHDQVFDVDPENLPPVPRVEQVVETCKNGWKVDKRDLEQCVPVHALMELGTKFHLRLELGLVEHVRVLEPEELERRRQTANHNVALCLWVVLLVGEIDLVVSKNTRGVEVVPDPVNQVITEEGKGYQESGSLVTIFHKENEHVNPEHHHKAAFKGYEGGDWSGVWRLGILAHQDAGEEDEGDDQCDERQGSLRRQITLILFIGEVRRRTLLQALILEQVEALEARSALVDAI